MASEGPLSPGTASNETNTGSVWSTTGNITASDDSYATRTFGAGGTSDYLRATNFGFSIPSGATIDGIVVEVERKSSAGFAYVDYSTGDSCKLVKAGSAVGTGKPNGSYWPTTEAYQSYGGAADLWGTTWTDTDINNSGFGFQLAVFGYFKSPTMASVDHIRITVHYTGGGASFIAQSNPRPIQAVRRASSY